MITTQNLNQALLVSGYGGFLRSIIAFGDILFVPNMGKSGWLDLRGSKKALWVVLGKVSELVGRNCAKISFIRGDGKRTRFWHNAWCEDWTLKVLYPNLFLNAEAKMHSSLLNSREEGLCYWNLGCVWAFHEGNWNWLGL